MPNNVYIGSRYVPIFDGDYNNTKNYEGLTIVNYQGSSYTSKGPVPAGILPTNTAYWALTGNYNGQISNLQQQIGNLSNLNTTAKDNLVNAVNEVQGIASKIDDIRKYSSRRVVCVSDSYGSNEAQFSGYSFFPILGNYISERGFGFLRTGYMDGASFGWANKLYLTVLQGLTVPDKSSITDILIVGGFNDLCNYISSGVCTLADIETGIEDFITYCKTEYPNATVAFIPVGYKGGDDAGIKWLEILENLPKIKEMCNKHGMKFADNAINTLIFTGSQIADGTHPNADGQTAIAQTVMQYLLNGTVDINRYYSALPTDVTLGTGVDSVYGLQWYEHLKNGVIDLVATNINLGCTALEIKPFNQGGTTLFTFKNSVKHFIHNSAQLCGGFRPALFRSSTTNLAANVVVWIANGVVKAGTLDDNSVSPIYNLYLRFGNISYDSLMV